MSYWEIIHDHENTAQNNYFFLKFISLIMDNKLATIDIV